MKSRLERNLEEYYNGDISEYEFRVRVLSSVYVYLWRSGRTWEATAFGILVGY